MSCNDVLTEDLQRKKKLQKTIFMYSRLSKLCDIIVSLGVEGQAKEQCCSPLPPATLDVKRPGGEMKYSCSLANLKVSSYIKPTLAVGMQTM